MNKKTDVVNCPSCLIQLRTFFTVKLPTLVILGIVLLGTVLILDTGCSYITGAQKAKSFQQETLHKIGIPSKASLQYSRVSFFAFNRVVSRQKIHTTQRNTEISSFYADKLDSLGWSFAGEEPLTIHKEVIGKNICWKKDQYRIEIHLYDLDKSGENRYSIAISWHLWD